MSSVTQKISGLGLRLGVHSDRHRLVTLAGGQSTRERKQMNTITAEVREWHTIKTEVQVSDSAVWELMTGTGWSRYGWWCDPICATCDEVGIAECHGDHTMHVGVFDPQDDSKVISKVVTVADVVAAINALPHAAHAWVSDELDSADIFDEVMQVAVLGEVVYS